MANIGMGPSGGIKFNYGKKPVKPGAPNIGAAGLMGTTPISPAQYQAILESHPSYIVGAGDYRAQAQDLAEQRRAAVRQQVLASGMVPETYVDKFGDIDAETMAAAQGATQSGISTQAQLQKQYADQMRQGRNSLAARGMGRSGEMVYQANELELADRLRRSQAYSQVMGGLNTANQSYASGMATNQRNLGDLAQRIYDQYRQNLPTVVPGATAGKPRRPPVTRPIIDPRRHF